MNFRHCINLVAALGLGGLTLAGCSTAPSTGSDNATAAQIKGAEVNCVAPQVTTMLRDQIFDQAIVNAKDATQNLNNLRSAIVGRIESPLLQGHDPALKRTQCAGRLVFGLPPSVFKAFDGATSLSADVTYAVQPAADKSGIVVTAEGVTPIVDQLVTASQKKRLVRVKIPNPVAPRIVMGPGDIMSGPAELLLPPLPRAEPLPPPSIDVPSAAARPSFGCKGNLSRVEKMICSDSMLADQDRSLATAYKAARSRTPAGEVAQLESMRGKYLGRRNACSNAQCVASVYDDWIGALSDWNSDYQG
jgi:hypothetical protein